jgi:monovalent cation/hydrogen antiporter
VVSLAAALSIPVYLSDGVPFPHRNLILFITFIAIITTLLLQGLTLPYVIRKVKIQEFKDYLPDEEAIDIIKKGLAQSTIEHIDNMYSEHLTGDIHLQQLSAKWKEVRNKTFETERLGESKRIHLDILEQQRRWLLNKNKTDDQIDEEVVRKFLHQIDLEEEKVKAT